MLRVTLLMNFVFPRTVKRLGLGPGPRDGFYPHIRLFVPEGNATKWTVHSWEPEGVFRHSQNNPGKRWAPSSLALSFDRVC